MRILAFPLLFVALALEAIALSYVLDVHAPIMASFGLLALAVYFATEAYMFGGFARILAIVAAMAALGLALFLGSLGFNAEYLAFFAIYAVISAFAIAALSRNEPIRKRYLLYLISAAVLVGFVIAYAILAVYVTFEASRRNLSDTGRFAPIKRLSVYFSGTVLLAYNAAVVAAELVGLYKPNPNLYYVSALVVVTVLLAVRNLVSFVPRSGRLAFLRYLVPSFIALYVASYALIKFDTVMSVLDGLAKSLAALAAIAYSRNFSSDLNMSPIL